MTTMRDAAMSSKAWPFEEARRLLKRYEKAPPEKGYVLFETGYGPSGLPHIGTFGEVLRTTMIRRAFEAISDIPTKLICFSDDLDGMRKVPGNVPNRDMLAEHLQKPLTSVPDPFGTHESFGAHNNAMLRRFLDTFGKIRENFQRTFVEFFERGCVRDRVVLDREGPRPAPLVEPARPRSLGRGLLGLGVIPGGIFICIFVYYNIVIMSCAFPGANGSGCARPQVFLLNF